jgi:hypothetical protein
MGVMLYGLPPTEVAVDDRTLAHLKVVIVNKLRRNESFLLSWQPDPATGEGRMSVWMHPSIPLQFRFEAARPPALNGAWLEEMARTSMAPEGLHIGPEPTRPISEPVSPPAL